MVNKILKEASDIIDSLIQKVETLESKLSSLENENLKLKEELEIQKLASSLEEKSLISEQKAISLRNGELTKDEVNKLKVLLEYKNSYDDNSLYDIEKVNKISSYNYENPIEAMHRRREERAEQLYYDILSVLNKK